MTQIHPNAPTHPYFRQWLNMIAHVRETDICEDWYNFSSFLEWREGQGEGHMWAMYDGSIHSPETTMIVTSREFKKLKSELKNEEVAKRVDAIKSAHDVALQNMIPAILLILDYEAEPITANVLFSLIPPQSIVGISLKKTFKPFLLKNKDLLWITKVQPNKSITIEKL